MRSAAKRGPPAHSSRPSTVASAPRPGRATKLCGGRDVEPALVRGAQQRPAERVLGAALDRRDQRQHAVALGAAEATSMLASCGVPSVSVPVLSTATVSMRPSASSASPPLTSTPARAAPPTADTTATGTEITSAHGHATMSSASARYSQVSRSPPRSTGTTASSSAAANTSGV